jgi:hypothetical protein
MNGISRKCITIDKCTFFTVNAIFLRNWSSAKRAKTRGAEHFITQRAIACHFSQEGGSVWMELVSIGPCASNYVSLGKSSVTLSKERLLCSFFLVRPVRLFFFSFSGIFIKSKWIQVYSLRLAAAAVSNVRVPHHWLLCQLNGNTVAQPKIETAMYFHRGL